MRNRQLNHVYRCKVRRTAEYEIDVVAEDADEAGQIAGELADEDHRVSEGESEIYEVTDMGDSNDDGD